MPRLETPAWERTQRQDQPFGEALRAFVKTRLRGQHLGAEESHMRGVHRGAVVSRETTRGLLAVPCKAMIVGEYSVLEPGGAALAFAEGTGLRIHIQSAPGLGLRIPVLGLDRRFDVEAVTAGEEPAEGLDRCFWWACKVVLAYTGRNMRGIKADPERSGLDDGILEGEGVSLLFEPVGFQGTLPVGSSAAVTVGTVRGVSQRLGIALEDTTVYRLAAAAHALAQKGGSAYDVAASAMGDWTLYERDALGALPWDGWDAETCSNQDALTELLAFAFEFGTWPRIRRRKRLPVGVILADTGMRAHTATFLQRLDARRHQPGVVQALREHQTASNTLARSLWEGKPAPVVREGVREAVVSLQKLDSVSKLGIHTPEIEALLFEAARNGIAAKVSGAGGGDCVVGLVWSKEEYQRCLDGWFRLGFQATPLVMPG